MAEKNNNYRSICSEDEEANTNDQFLAKLNEITADIGSTREFFLFGL